MSKGFHDAIALVAFMWLILTPALIQLDVNFWIWDTISVTLLGIFATYNSHTWHKFLRNFKKKDASIYY